MTKDEKIKVLTTALIDIVNPISALERDMEPGYTLNGFAVQLANDPNHLKLIAKEALSKIST